MKIAFINPPFLPRFSRGQRSPGVIKSGTLYYPYWLAYAAGMAEKHGHEISLIDCPAEGRSVAWLLDELLRQVPDLVVLETSTPSWESDGRLAERIKQALPESRICLTGTHVTALWQETLERFPGVDTVAVGEIDLTVAELADALQSGRDLQEVPGLAYRGSATIRRTAERPLLQDLDSLPWAAPIYRRFLDLGRYYFNLCHHPMIMLIGGRGCTSMCFYCVYPQVMHGHRYRHRSAADLVDEMLWVQENLHQIKEIAFEDDNFAADPAFARDFAARVVESGVKLPFFANLRTTVDYDTLA
ncbi:cobalamin-dependent protein, partial [candidate division KSB1 bacterium]|nr:cobalamin-dependent protein [candidate division KSB1 bacterium]